MMASTLEYTIFLWDSGPISFLNKTIQAQNWVGALGMELEKNQPTDHDIGKQEKEYFSAVETEKLAVARKLTMISSRS